MGTDLRMFLAWNLGAFAFACGLRAAALPPLPSWVGTVGASERPTGGGDYIANSFGARPDGKSDSTAAIQKAIDAANSAGGGTVSFSPGEYRTGALFIKSHVHLLVAYGVTLMAIPDDAAYPVLPTRVAGVEMAWPSALLNVNGQEDVEISGAGTIDGEGQFWWKKYWDLRKQYAPRGLRWAADYDCQRVRLVVVWRSKNVTLAGLKLRRSGFWNVQVTYSDSVTVDHLTIADNFSVDGVKGASTDGVDIDSSRRVLIQGCDIDNNDDDICLKAGRDADGLRVDKPTEYVVIRDNTCRRGGGVVSFGSETSGGIQHVVAYHDTGIGTSEGLRFKSSRTRGGFVQDVLIEDVTLKDVPKPFTFTLDWNSAYSTVTIPPGTSPVPEYWKTLAEPVTPPERGHAYFSNITIAGVTATGAETILSAAGLPDKPLGEVQWLDVTADGKQAGTIRYATNWTMERVSFGTADGHPVTELDCTNVALPQVDKIGAGAQPVVRPPPSS